MDRPHNLMQADHAGEAGPEPSEQLRNDPVTASRSSNVTLGPSSPATVRAASLTRARRAPSRWSIGEDVRRDSGLRRVVDRRRRRVPRPHATDGARFHHHPPRGAGARALRLSLPAMRSPSTMRRSARRSPRWWRASSRSPASAQAIAAGTASMIEQKGHASS